MPTTLEEVLKQSGYTDEQIKALDPRVLTAFGGVISEAEKVRQQAQAAREAAELAQRSNVDFYENKIVPSLSNWEEEKQRIENERARSAAEAAFYRTQNEEAKKSGFIATDAPGFDVSRFTPPNPSIQPREPNGRWVAGQPGATPGSPQYVDANLIAQRAGDALSLFADIQWEHQKLFGQPLPVSPSELVRQADAVKLDPRTYAARAYNWDARREQIRADEEKTRNDKIAAEAVAPWQQKFKDQEAEFKKKFSDREREWAEKVGSNPDIRQPSFDAKFTDIQKGRKEGTIPDPLTLNEHERRALTQQMIRKDIAELENPAA